MPNTCTHKAQDFPWIKHGKNIGKQINKEACHFLSMGAACPLAAHLLNKKLQHPTGSTGSSHIKFN
jgi:hypothetical protein